MTGEMGSIGPRLNQFLAEAGLPAQSPDTLSRFQSYYDLFIRWNAKLNLSAIRDREGILSRHFVESIACALAIPEGVSTLLDLGSGGGFPGVPIAICRREIAVTLAESQTKKAAFLNELVRTLGLTARVHHGRAETLPDSYDCVTLRAVDRMSDMVEVAAGLTRVGGWLVLMATVGDSDELMESAGKQFSWLSVVPSGIGTPGRVILLGQRLKGVSQERMFHVEHL